MCKYLLGLILMNLWTDNDCLENDEDRKLQISRKLFHYITFPLVTTEITEPRLALRWISSVNYSTCILFLRVRTCSPTVQINNTSIG